MRLEKLYLSRGLWSDKGLSGSIEFSNELGKIELKLSDDAARRILRVVADELVAVSKAAADEMTASVLDAVPVQAIENDR